MEYFIQIPTVYTDQIILGPEMVDGINKDGEALGLKQTTAAEMTAKTEGLVQANKVYNISRSAQETAYVNFHASDDALTTWMGKVTGTLSAFYGKRWNRQWVQVGFNKPSLRLPRAIKDRLSLSLNMIDFLQSNPGYEAPNQGVTAVSGKALRDAVVLTQKLATDADADLTNKGTARVTASDTLTSYMRLLVGNLAELLAPDDTRWLDFGLEMPASIATPAAPIGLTVTANAMQEMTKTINGVTTRTVLVTCDATAFADRYRFRMREVGLETPYELVASVTEPMAQIEVPANVAVEIIVQAVNGDRQSVPSDPVVSAPVPTAPATTTVAAAIEQAVAPASANGSNGHAKSSVAARR